MEQIHNLIGQGEKINRKQLVKTVEQMKQYIEDMRELRFKFPALTAALQDIEAIFDKPLPWEEEQEETFEERHFIGAGLESSHSHAN